MSIFEGAYVAGYRAALGAASAECRHMGEALDHAGNVYVRYEDAIKCSVRVAALRPPEVVGFDSILVDAERALDLAQALLEQSNHHGTILAAYTNLRAALARCKGGAK